MVNFDVKLWQALIENYGKLWWKIMASFDRKLWQTLIENYGKL
jgi:flagellar biosynthesis regulator FlaF